MNVNNHRYIANLLFFWVLYTVFEYADSYYPNLVKSIIRKTHRINPYNMTNITGYAYFSISGARYPTIFDDYLNLSVFGAVILRSVQYCQYKRVSSSVGLFNTLSDIETYPAKWVSGYIDSSNFLDKNFVNPPLKIIVNETKTVNNIKIGNLTIQNDFYPATLDYYYFEPDEIGVANFTYSNASLDFEFIRRGYFYHSVTNKSSNSQIKKIQNDFKTKRIKYDDLLYDSQQMFFEKCHSGDVRIRYLLYAPLNVTYFGYIDNFTLKSKIVKNVRFGTTKRGVNHDLNSLVEQFVEDSFFSGNGISQFFIKIRIIFNIWKFIIRMFRDQPLKYSYWIVAIALANFAYRSILWDIWYLNFKIWASAFLAHMAAGFIVGIWMIPPRISQYINGQNRENQNQI